MSINQSDVCASAKVYVVAHKEAEFPSDALYVPIQVGLGAAFLDVRDSEGYNIANKSHFLRAYRALLDLEERQQLGHSRACAL